MPRSGSLRPSLATSCPPATCPPAVSIVVVTWFSSAMAHLLGSLHDQRETPWIGDSRNRRLSFPALMPNTTAAGRARPLAMTAALLVAALLRTWRLHQNGYDNEYDSAAVRSMSLGWHNFLYNSFDLAGFVSVDKPPLALWIQVASVKVFGYHSWSVLLPQVLVGMG